MVGLNNNVMMRYKRMKCLFRWYGEMGWGFLFIASCLVVLDFGCCYEDQLYVICMRALIFIR